MPSAGRIIARFRRTGSQLRGTPRWRRHKWRGPTGSSKGKWPLPCRGIRAAGKGRRRPPGIALPAAAQRRQFPADCCCPPVALPPPYSLSGRFVYNLIAPNCGAERGNGAKGRKGIRKDILRMVGEWGGGNEEHGPQLISRQWCHAKSTPRCCCCCVVLASQHPSSHPKVCVSHGRPGSTISSPHTAHFHSGCVPRP